MNDVRFEIGNVTIEEVLNMIKDIVLNKNSCIEGISTKILKSAFIVKPEALLLLFNTSLLQGIFPRDWAVGYVNLLPLKGGDRKNPSN